MSEPCAICWTAHDWRGFHSHHIITRGQCAGKKGCNAPYNKIRTCAGCHDDYHGMKRPGFPGLNLANVLWAQRESGIWEPKELQRLRSGRPLPALERPPERYMQARQENRPDLTSFGTDLSPEAEAIVNDPHWPAHWWPFKFMEQGRIWWEVREKHGAVIGFVAMARGDTDVEACRAAVDRRED